jgi:UDP-N-acetylglucosamine 4,6-dehydratase
LEQANGKNGTNVFQTHGVLRMNWENKNILITGGTGSFGHQIVSQLIESMKPNKIVIYSRDEKKQYDMQNEFEGQSDLIEFIIGDVRDYAKIHEATKNIDIIYHAAALKQVPNCEFHPFEAVKTNIIGAENVRRASIENNVEVVVAVSTDKAVKPINVMGMTKAIQERIMLNPTNGKWNTKFICVRYGNVVGSRGSVIPFFKRRIEEGKFLPITSYEMTRFLLRLEEAIDLVFKATVEGETGQLFVKKMPAGYIRDLAKVMSKAITEKEDYPIKEVGFRPGEKIHEVLVSEEEMRRVVETETHYVIYPYEELEKPHLMSDLKEYTSSNTQILNEDEIALLLKQEGWI